MNLNHAAGVVLNLILTIFHLIFSAFGALETWLRHELMLAGIRGQSATLILVLVAVLFFVGALRLFGGALQLLILLFLLLFSLQVLFAISPA